MTVCERCGLEPGLWVTLVPGLGRQHDLAPRGFDGTLLRAYGNDSVAQVYVSSHVDFTVPGRVRTTGRVGAPARPPPERLNIILDARTLRAYDRHGDAVRAGQLHLDGPAEWWCV